MPISVVLSLASVRGAGDELGGVEGVWALLEEPF